MKFFNPYVSIREIILTFIFIPSLLVFANAQTPVHISLHYNHVNSSTQFSTSKSNGFSISIGDLTTGRSAADGNFLSSTRVRWKSGVTVHDSSLTGFGNFVAKLNGKVIDSLAGKPAAISFTNLISFDADSISIAPFLGTNIQLLPFSIIFTKDQPGKPDNSNSDAPKATADLHFDTTGFRTGDYSKEDYIHKLKLHNLIIFYPGAPSHWEVYRNGKLKKALWYKGSGNTGKNSAVLLIDNFNTAMYNISATNSSISYTSTLPSIFSTVTAALSAPGVTSSGNPGDATGQTQSSTFTFNDFITLNKYIRQMLPFTFGDFKAKKNEVVAWVNKKFPNGINADYQLFIIQNSGGKIVTPATPAPAGGATPPAQPSDDFKTKLFSQYHVIPDTLIKQDVQLYTLLQNTVFTYEYDVIQLQNVDQLQFTVNVTPTTGSNSGATNPGVINTVSQPFNIPVLGGVKFDFSTGFYYSSVKNENYALYNPTPGTAGTPLAIVKENNYKGGAVGVAGLIHIYYPFAESWTPNLCAGVGASNALNYSFLAGGGLMFTVAGQNKVNISSGYNMSSIKKLSNGELDSNENPVNVPSATTSITYANNYKHGWFLSLTYSFGLSKATQSASSNSPTATPTAAAAATPAATGAATAGTGKGH